MPRLSLLTSAPASPVRRAFGFALMLILLSSPFGAPGRPTSVRPQPEEPSLLFSWAQTSRDLGSVVLPATGTGGWHVGPFALRYRTVPSFTKDVTLEVIVAAPDSGHPTLPERFMLQYPRNWAKRPLKEKAVVVGFHSFSVSEKQIFLDTDLPFECARRGWMLVAPYGLKDENFANVGTQQSLENILLILHSLVGYNHERIYGVGFSMGGLNAVSYAMRHQDQGKPRFAAVVSHTGTVDMIREYDNADAFRQQRLRNPFHFGASPTNDPFEYERVSPALILNSGLLDPDKAPVCNALHIPFYFHANLADPNTELLAHTLELKNYLAFRGATVYENLTVDPVAGHSWTTLPMAQALDSVSIHSLPGPPQILDVFADRQDRWLYSDVLVKPDNTHARYQIEISPIQLSRVNSFRITQTENLDSVRLRLRAMGLDPTTDLTFECSSVDATSDVFVLKGYPTPPQALRVLRARSWNWTHDAARKELRIRIAYGRGSAKVLIRP